MHFSAFIKLVAARIGWNSEQYEVDEGAGELEVCIRVYSPEIECPVAFPFEITSSSDTGKV